MSNPVTKVLGTYELLENILIGLSPAQLFVNKRVSKSWLDLITRSKGIRQLCFLEPTGDSISPKRHADYEHAPLILNPLLRFKDIAFDSELEGFKYGRMFKVKASEKAQEAVPNINRHLLLTQPPCTTTTIAALILRDKPPPPAPGAGESVAKCRNEWLDLKGPDSLCSADSGLRVGDLIDWISERALAVTGNESVRIMFNAAIYTDQELEY